MTKCVILAAGMGSRLRPYTNNLPKTLVPFLGKPIVNYQLAVLKTCGITDISLVTGYRAEKLSHIKLKSFKNVRYKSTNMVYSLLCARSFFEKADEDLLISYGDIIYEKEILYKLLQSDRDFTITTDDNWEILWRARMNDPLSDAEVLKFDYNNEISEIGRKPVNLKEVESQYMGLIKISRKRIKNFLDFLADYQEDKLDKLDMTSLIQDLINNNWVISAARVKSGWLEFDSKDDLELFEGLFALGELDSLIKL